MSDSFADMHSELSLEIGRDLSRQFIDALLLESGGDIIRCKKLYFELGYVWAPVIRGWSQWIMRKAKYQPYIVLRDAKPLTAIFPSNGWPKVWLNRVICGIRDELSGDIDQPSDPLLDRYIQEMRLNEPFTLVDTGCWGTVVKHIAQNLDLQFQPLFFYSHNPHIPGYLNSFKMEDNMRETLNDSLECCFLNAYSRPRRLITKNGSVVPDSEYLDGLLAELGLIAMEGLRQGSEDVDLSDRQGIDQLLVLHERAKQGRFSGILPIHSNTWSDGESFLREWESNPPNILN